MLKLIYIILVSSFLGSIAAILASSLWDEFKEDSKLIAILGAMIFIPVFILVLYGFVNLFYLAFAD